ncbi:MAG: T9SS type A sorting domain-containing protein, partial [Bacteroidia bacterium]
FPDGLFFNSPTDGFLYGQGCFGGAMLSHWNGTSWQQDQMLDYTMLSNFEYVHITGMAHNPLTSRTIAVCNGGKIFSSTNNFQTWDTIPHPNPTDFSAVDYAGGNTFYASAINSQFNVVLISTDNGQTFTTDQTFPFSFYYPEFRDVDMLSNGFGVVGGFGQTNQGGILQVRNTTGWSQQIDATDHAINAVFVVDSTLAFAVGDSGSIYRYDNLTSVISAPVPAAAQLQLFPSVMNSTDQLTINFPASEIFQLDVIDMQGRSCAVISNCSGAMQFSAAQLGINSGMYILRATGSKSVRSSRLIIY